MSWFSWLFGKSGASTAQQSKKQRKTRDSVWAELATAPVPDPLRVDKWLEPTPSPAEQDALWDALAKEWEESVIEGIAIGGKATFSDDELAAFLFGAWVTCNSTNVIGAQYDGEQRRLTLEFKQGWYYQYEDISDAEAESFALAGSKGTWVWDELRVRGTTFGFKKRYVFLSGPSRGQPLWMDTAERRLWHGQVPPEGETPEERAAYPNVPLGV